MKPATDDAHMPTVALLAGGLATRMRPLTSQIPKALLEVAGEPFIAHQLKKLKHEGVSHVVVCTGYLGEQIEQFVGDGSRFGLRIDFRHDGPRLRGTGGALRGALDLLGDDFLVLYGDSWLDVPYQPIVKAFRHSGAAALMTVFRNSDQWDQSNVWFEDGTIKLYDKRTPLPQMQHIDWGLGVISASTLATLANDRPLDLADVYSDLSRAGKLAGYEVTTRFYEIGSAEGLRQTDAVLRQGQIR